MTRVVERDEPEAVVEKSARQALSHGSKPYEPNRRLLCNHSSKTPFDAVG